MPEENKRVILLFSKIQSGNKAAFDELFNRYYHRLVCFAKHYTGQQVTAEEITSEFFVKIWLMRTRLSAILHPEIYLYVSIRNACFNLNRSDKKRLALLRAEPVDDSIGQAVYNGDNDMEGKELAHILNLAVDALPAQRRLIFRLVKEEGLKGAEVAAAMGISVRTVENQLYKAVKTLAAVTTAYLGYNPQVRLPRKQLSFLLSFLSLIP